MLQQLAGHLAGRSISYKKKWGMHGRYQLILAVGLMLGLSLISLGCASWSQLGLGEDLNLSSEPKKQDLTDALPLQSMALNLSSNPYYTRSGLNPFVPNLVGQCTWYVYGRIQEAGLITRDVLRTARNRNGGQGIFLGNANTWDDDARSAGFATGHEPRVGAIAVWESGHVAYVEDVLPDGSIRVTESNFPTSNSSVLVGHDVVVNTSTNLRVGPGLKQSVLWLMPPFTTMRVIAGPRQADGYTWFQLQGNGYTGWAARFTPTTSCTSKNICWNYTGISLQSASPVRGTPSIYIYLKP